MLNDPDFYGLTYDAYQMITFEIEVPSVNHNKKEMTNEEKLRQQVLYDLEHSHDKGPEFPEVNDVDLEELIKRNTEDNTNEKEEFKNSEKTQGKQEEL